MLKDIAKVIKAEGQDISHAINRVPVTPEIRKHWEEVRTALLWYCPAFSHVLYTMMSKGNEQDLAIFTDSKEVPTAATDGFNLIFNAKWFMTLDIGEGAFVAAHEIMHAVYNHCALSYQWRERGFVHHNGKDLHYDDDTMNRAMDFVINDALITGKVGKFKEGGCWDQSIATGFDAVVDVYAKILPKDQGGGGRKADGNSHDKLLKPGQANNDGKNAQQAMLERSDQQWVQALADGMVAAKAQGRLPENIERLLRQLTQPKVSWTDKIHGFFNRHVGSGSYNYRKPDRRLIVRDIYAPSRTGHNAGTIVIGLDTSGSIFYDGDQLDRFVSEVSGILDDVNPQRLILLHCDAYVHKVEEPSSLADLEKVSPKGGGGTSFRPVFRWIENELDNEVDALVYLTDGYGDFPQKAPNYPVLWGDCTGKPEKYPFGEVVEIPK